VPCTTRSARPGEVNGQDYIFLTNEQFLELEQAGDLLEYGVYNGHYYGTPKPPKSSSSALNNSENSNSLYKQNSYNHLMGNQALEDDEEEDERLPKRNGSISDMTSLLNLKKINNVNNSFEGKFMFLIYAFFLLVI
jgi:hypothetical protein